MSKSRGNVINPDDVVFDFGADSLRLYEMFMGPLRDTKVGLVSWQVIGSCCHFLLIFGGAAQSQVSRAIFGRTLLAPGPTTELRVCGWVVWPRQRHNFLCCCVCLQVWSTRGVEGVHRFLARVYRAFEGGVSTGNDTKLW